MTLVSRLTLQTQLIMIFRCHLPSGFGSRRPGLTSPRGSPYLTLEDYQSSVDKKVSLINMTDRHGIDFVCLHIPQGLWRRILSRSRPLFSP
jgi:hypothetical protein